MRSTLRVWARRREPPKHNLQRRYLIAPQPFLVLWRDKQDPVCPHPWHSGFFAGLNLGTDLTIKPPDAGQVGGPSTYWTRVDD
jgi:hypothetical protein